MIKFSLKRALPYSDKQMYAIVIDVKKYISPDQFKYFESLAYKKGFSMVSSSPLTRSSYHADQDFENLKINKININDATITND